MIDLRRHSIKCALVSAAACALSAAAGEGEAAKLSTEGARFRMQPEPGASGGAAEAEIGEAPVPARYGAEGTEWILFGGGAAYDFTENTDINVNVGYSRFLVDDVEWLVELAAWYHAQDGDDAMSLNPAMEFRWHFYNGADWSVFLNAGIGVLGATDNVPDGGTSFDLTPRLGVGFTRRIGEGAARLIGGVRWHHISNARSFGENNNPSRDAPMLYVQVAVPF